MSLFCAGGKRMSKNQETMVRHVGDGGKMQVFVYQNMCMYDHVCRCRCVIIYIERDNTL